MLLNKKKKYEEEIKNLQKEKYDMLMKEIEILQQILCKFDNNLKRCIVDITLNRRDIDKNKGEIGKLNNTKEEDEYSYIR